ncbi:hypothetical protein B9Z55_027057 [Caenorhabditis nigoni]|uniref:Uncharacterized protein n=1 Tax=Caenorhabditis nigoni TaxID=1611254 RepID=A0A2G5SJ30_9PELO|nr:hypothetical protein B9Z55_027057 [Caenorhabditis nigoni]
MLISENSTCAVILTLASVASGCLRAAVSLYRLFNKDSGQNNTGLYSKLSKPLKRDRRMTPLSLTFEIKPPTP